MELECFECQKTITADDPGELGEALLVHARGEHQWPFPDQGIRNFAEATQRLTGPSERLEDIGEVVIERVTEDRLEDWLRFFDHDGFVGKPEWAGCYCLEPHTAEPGAEPEDVPHWSQNRAAMIERLRNGGAYGYLAYADGRPAGWVNASLRSDYTLYPVNEAAPPGAEVIGVSCFVIGPAFRNHGVASRLLDRVLADAPSRGARFVEAYPFKDGVAQSEADHFRGPRAMYDARGFEPAEERERYVVVRRPV